MNAQEASDVRLILEISEDRRKKLEAQRQHRRAMRVLDHAIDHLGPTHPCFLLIVEGKMSNVPSTESNADAARAVLIGAMLELVKEQSRAA